jgi:LysM repeat protein
MASARKFGKEIPKNALIYVPADKKDLVQNEFSPPPRNLPPPRAEEGDLSSYESAAKSEKPHSYKVISGDNWFSIARDFGVTVQELLDANKLKITKDLRVGQELSIP